jgi:hypothetical protein
MSTKTSKAGPGARGSKVKNPTTNPKKLSAKRSGTKRSSVKKSGSAMSATRGLHGGRRKSV